MLKRCAQTGCVNLPALICKLNERQRASSKEGSDGEGRVETEREAGGGDTAAVSASPSCPTSISYRTHNSIYEIKKDTHKLSSFKKQSVNVVSVQLEALNQSLLNC